MTSLCLTCHLGSMLVLVKFINGNEITAKKVFLFIILHFKRKYVFFSQFPNLKSSGRASKDILLCAVLESKQWEAEDRPKLLSPLDTMFHLLLNDN